MELPTDTGFYALVGAAIGALPASISAWYSARASERGQLRKAVIEASKDIWLERRKHQTATLPYELSLIYTALMADLAFNKSVIDEDAVRTRVVEINRVMDRLVAESSQKST